MFELGYCYHINLVKRSTKERSITREHKIEARDTSSHRTVLLGTRDQLFSISAVCGRGRLDPALGFIGGSIVGALIYCPAVPFLVSPRDRSFPLGVNPIKADATWYKNWDKCHVQFKRKKYYLLLCALSRGHPRAYHSVYHKRYTPFINQVMIISLTMCLWMYFVKIGGLMFTG